MTPYCFVMKYDRTCFSASVRRWFELSKPTSFPSLTPYQFGVSERKSRVYNKLGLNKMLATYCTLFKTPLKLFSPSRSFVGHINEKNFVGLATDGDYITCGSENNSLYVYYRGLSKPLFRWENFCFFF
jgi:hypothetical protein